MNNKLSGLCVSPGNAEGYVVLCRDITSVVIPNNKNIILVLPYLDRDIIIKLSSNVVGVISEKGSIGSHGAGILRELRIPCIVRIPNVLSILHQGDFIKIVDSEDSVYCNTMLPSRLQHNTNLLYTTYKQFNTDRSNQIRISQSIDCYRPTRRYQRLRFDMLKPAWETSPNFLFGLQKCEIFQNELGIVLIKNGPRILDICSYLIEDPERLIRISRARSLEVERIDNSLDTLNNLVNSDNTIEIGNGIRTAVQHYRDLMKYVYISQYISDEIIEIFLDVVSEFDISSRQHFIRKLSSEYVMTSIVSKEDPGISQKWILPSRNPFVWRGNINYEPFRLDEMPESTINRIKADSSVFNDIISLLKLVPLVYQMSEEFFYTSSSINSFINRGLDRLSHLFSQNGLIQGAFEDIYDWSLERLYSELNIQQ